MCVRGSARWFKVGVGRQDSAGKRQFAAIGKRSNNVSATKTLKTITNRSDFSVYC